MNLGSMIEESCSRFPERIALIHEGKRITYAELNRAVNALGNHLKKLGIGKGDHISIMLPNSPDFVISYFAAQKIGAVVVTINVMSTPYELHHFLHNSDSKVFITVTSSARRYDEIKDRLPLCKHLILTDEKEDSQFRTIVNQGPFELETAGIDGDDDAVMIYTSGLTGKPLGAVLTHNNLMTQAALLKVLGDGDENDRALAVIPFFHSFGAAANMIAILKSGAGTVLMERFTLDTIFSAIQNEKVTYICAVPRLFLGMLFHDKADQYDISSLRFCITGGSAMNVEIFNVFAPKFNVKLLEGYGLTEASPITALSRLDMPFKPGSIGIPIPGVEARIIDDQGVDLPAGETGELIIRGPNVMKGYYKDPDATTQVIREGWLHTSDLGYIDRDGYIFLTGRKKRMVITSGFNVYPKEVEIVLSMHPAVKESRIISQPDLMRGEIVKAFIIKNPDIAADERDILKHCRTYLSSYKIPREVEFVDAIPDE